MGRVARIHIRIHESGHTAYKDFPVQPFEVVMVTKGQTFPIRVDIGTKTTTADGLKVWDSGFIPVECDSVEVLDVET